MNLRTVTSCIADCVRIELALRCGILCRIHLTHIASDFRFVTMGGGGRGHPTTIPSWNFTNWCTIRTYYAWTNTNTKCWRLIMRTVLLCLQIRSNSSPPLSSFPNSRQCSARYRNGKRRTQNHYYTNLLNEEEIEIKKVYIQRMYSRLGH